MIVRFVILPSFALGLVACATAPVQAPAVVQAQEQRAVEPQAECRVSLDCRAGEVCRDGRCVPGVIVADRGPDPGPESSAFPSCEFVAARFDFDASTIRPDAAAILRADAACAAGREVVVEGHCDERGTTEYNVALGDRRARSAAAYLRRLDADIVRVVSFGEARPVDPRHEKAAWAANRRVEIRLP